MKLSSLNKFLKAIFAGAGAALTGLGTALVQVHTFSAISDGTWVTIAALAFGSFGAVYSVTNSTTPPKPPPVA